MLRKKIKIKKPNGMRICLIILLVISLFLTQTKLNTSNYTLLYNIEKTFIVIVAFLGILFSFGKIVLKKREFMAYAMILVPYIIIIALSIIEAAIAGEISVRYTISEASGPFVMTLAAILVYKYLDRNIIDLLFWALLINNSIYVIIFAIKYGISGFMHFIEIADNYKNFSLELHEITFIWGLLIIYYFTTGLYKTEKNKFVCAIVFCILGFKRILIGAIIIVVGITTFLHAWSKNGKESESKKGIYFVGIIMFMCCVAWLIISSTTLIDQLADLLGINLMSRGHSIQENGVVGLYGRLDGKYELSLTYLGKGFGYVNREMINYAHSLQSFATTGFHNDILKYYIDLGCIPWTLLFLNLTLFNTRRIYKYFSKQQSINYLMITGMTLVCWTTDNLATYPNYLFAFAAVFVTLLLESKNIVRSNVKNG